MQVAFKDRAHREFYLGAMKKCENADSYHRALFYTLGMNLEVRNNIEQVFDFREDAIRPECLEAGWQTSGSERVVRMAFNLWNGWNGDGLATPYDLYDCEYTAYMLEAVKLRYPEYCRDLFALPKEIR